MKSEEETAAVCIPAARRISLPPSIRGVRAAFVFFTRFPAGGFPYTKDDHSWATAHAPCVGLVLGGVAAVVVAALEPLGSVAASASSVAALVWCTGALHEDGLADTADALGGATTRERLFIILKDSRIGAFGAAALCLSLLVRVALVERLGASAPWSLPLAECAARIGPACLIGALPYVTERETSKSHDLVRGGAARVIVATVWGSLALAGAVLASLLSVERALIFAGALGAAWLLLASVFRRRAGGVTGDFLGAAVQAGEIVALAVLAWRR
jgi:adenosylcobinamide-GDP ribazoletransferase